MVIERPSGEVAAAIIASNTAVASLTPESSAEERALAIALPNPGYFRLNILGMHYWMGFMLALRMLVLKRRSLSDIQAHKLASNDGWLVSATEIRAALRTYDGITRERVVEVIFAEPSNDGVPQIVIDFVGVRSKDEREADVAYWDQWIALLLSTTQCETLGSGIRERCNGRRWERGGPGGPRPPIFDPSRLTTCSRN